VFNRQHSPYLAVSAHPASAVVMKPMVGGRDMRVRVVLSGAALLLAGCYDYRVTTTPSSSPTGTRLRVELSDRGTSSVERALGASVTKVEGTVRDATPDRLTLALTSVERRGERPTAWGGDLLTLAPADMRELRVRTLNRGKTIIASVGVGAAVVGGIIAIAKATGLASGDGGRKPGPQPF